MLVSAVIIKGPASESPIVFRTPISATEFTLFIIQPHYSIKWLKTNSSPFLYVIIGRRRKNKRFPYPIDRRQDIDSIFCIDKFFSCNFLKHRWVELVIAITMTYLFLWKHITYKFPSSHKHMVTNIYNNNKNWLFYLSNRYVLL